MIRSQGYPLYGRRFMGDVVKKEVHDLDNEQIGENGCQINDIIASGQARIFHPDTLTQAD